MQNKPNLLDAQMNVKSFHTVDYENKSNWKLGENKPNTNPTCRGVASGEAGAKPISKESNEDLSRTNKLWENHTRC